MTSTRVDRAPEATTPDGSPGDPQSHHVGLKGRLLLDGHPEADCTLDTIAGKEATLAAAIPGQDDPCGRAVAYLEFVGRIEGSARRLDDGRLVLSIAAPEAKWARLRQQFAMLAAMPASDRDDLRGHRRVIPDAPEVEVSLAHGVVVAGRIRDVSRSGAAIEAVAAVTVGDRVTVGSTRGRVARLLDGGFAVEFARLLPLERFGASLRL